MGSPPNLRDPITIGKMLACRISKAMRKGISKWILLFGFKTPCSSAAIAGLDFKLALERMNEAFKCVPNKLETQESCSDATSS